MTSPLSISPKSSFENDFKCIDYDQFVKIDIPDPLSKDICSITIQVGYTSVQIEGTFSCACKSAEENPIELSDSGEMRIISRRGSNEKIVFAPFSKSIPKPTNMDAFKRLAIGLLEKENSKNQLTPQDSSYHPYFSISFSATVNKSTSFKSNENFEHLIRCFATEHAIYYLIAHDVTEAISEETKHFLNSFKILD